MYVIVMNEEGYMFAGDKLTRDIKIATKFNTEFEALQTITPIQWTYPHWKIKKIKEK